MRRLAWRWAKFNLVGALGVAVQLACLAVLRGWIHYLAATAVAVELAVLHNFFWHERFTWKDRPGGRRERLVRFHLGNGAVSIVGNVAVVWMVLRLFPAVPLLAANGVAIAICSLLNFGLAEWLVFRPKF